jgi:hypothetical protein
VLAAKKDPVEVCSVYGSPSVERRVLGIVGVSTVLEACDACTVHDNIKTTVGRQDFVDDLHPIRVLANIEMPIVRVGPQCLGNLQSFIIAQVAQPNARTFANESSGNGSANATRSPVTKAILPFSRMQ